MQIRRPISALLIALALFGGGTTTLAGCSGDPAGLDRNDGTSDDSENTGGSDQESEVPDNSDPDQGNEEDQNDDSQDPD
jgi:hypothetical protein